MSAYNYAFHHYLTYQILRMLDIVLMICYNHPDLKALSFLFFFYSLIKKYVLYL